jgi:hypothetical protein
MRGAPQLGLLRLIIRIRSRTSCGMQGRPGLPRRILHVQNKRKPLRCQATTVSALTIIRGRGLEHRGESAEPDEQALLRRPTEQMKVDQTSNCRSIGVFWRDSRLQLALPSHAAIENDKRGEIAQERLIPPALTYVRGDDIHADQA